VQQTLADRSLLADASRGSELACEDLVGPSSSLGPIRVLHGRSRGAHSQGVTKMRKVETGENVRPWFLAIVADARCNAT
jgi:hypothetical protein